MERWRIKFLKPHRSSQNLHDLMLLINKNITRGQIHSASTQNKIKYTYCKIIVPDNASKAQIY